MRKQPDKTFVKEIKVKGHALKVYFQGDGFSCELDDGQEVGGASLEELRKRAGELLEQAAKEVRPNVACCFDKGYGDSWMEPAVYVGKRKGAGQSWASCYLFDVGPQARRESLSGLNIGRNVYRPDIDLKELKKLKAEADAATKRLDRFLEANHFDPTGERE